MFLMIY